MMSEQQAVQQAQQTLDETLRRHYPDLFIADQSGPARRDSATRDLLSVFGPVIAENARLHALFEGGPDTVCRTTWRDEPGLFGATISVECVEVPMADLRLAFGVTDPYPDGHTCADPDAECASCEAESSTTPPRTERTPPP